MLRFGVWKRDQYLRAGAKRCYFGSRVSYDLLDVGTNPSEEDIRIFEDISFTLRTSNGTFRTTFRHRFEDVDAAALRWIRQFYPAPETELCVQDRAVSHALTSREWAEELFRAYPKIAFEASDTLFSLVRLTLPGGDFYVAEPDGTPLQYVHPPFVVSVFHPEARKYPLNRLIAAHGRRRFRQLHLPEGWTESSSTPGGCQVSRIPFVHPEAVLFGQRHPGFELRLRSVFEHTPARCHVLRTMNILNPAYFSEPQLIDGIEAVFDSLKPGGLWIVCKTNEDDFSNHATIFRRGEQGWEVLERIGTGSVLEDLALRTRFPRTVSAVE